MRTSVLRNFSYPLFSEQVIECFFGAYITYRNVTHKTLLINMKLINMNIVLQSFYDKL